MNPTACIAYGCNVINIDSKAEWFWVICQISSSFNQPIDEQFDWEYQFRRDGICPFLCIRFTRWTRHAFTAQRVNKKENIHATAPKTIPPISIGMNTCSISTANEAQVIVPESDMNCTARPMIIPHSSIDKRKSSPYPYQ